MVFLPKVAVFFVFLLFRSRRFLVGHNQLNAAHVVLRLYRNTFYTEYLRVNVAETTTRIVKLQTDNA